MEMLKEIIERHLLDNADVTEHDMEKWIELAIRAFGLPKAVTFIQAMGVLSIDSIAMSCNKCSKISTIRIIGPFDVIIVCEDCQLTERHSLRDSGWEKFSFAFECILCHGLCNTKGKFDTPKGGVCETCANKIIYAHINQMRPTSLSDIYDAIKQGKPIIVPSRIISDILKSATPSSTESSAPTGNAPKSPSEKPTQASPLTDYPGKADTSDNDFEDEHDDHGKHP
jgi:hypothetical protein